MTAEQLETLIGLKDDADIAADAYDEALNLANRLDNNEPVVLNVRAYPSSAVQAFKAANTEYYRQAAEAAATAFEEALMTYTDASSDPDTFTVTVAAAPTPTEADGVANNDKIQSIVMEGDTATIYVDLDELTSFASSDPNQGSGKWLALEVATGVVPITDVAYNGYSLTAQDISDAIATGCSEGSFVLYIKAEVVAATPKSFTLSSDGYTDKTITLTVTDLT